MSFQLSFLSVLCIALGVEWWRASLVPTAGDRPTWRSRLASRAALLLVTSVAAGVGTAPLVAHHFNQVNWVGLVANPIIIPLAGALVVPLGLASGVAAAAWHLPTLPLAPLNAAALDLLPWAVNAFADWPLSIVHVAAPSMAAMAVGDRGSRTRWSAGSLPGTGPVGGRSCCSSSRGRSASPVGDRRRAGGDVPDVGQEDGAVGRFPSGQVMVVDGGSVSTEPDTGRRSRPPCSGLRGGDPSTIGRQPSAARSHRGALS